MYLKNKKKNSFSPLPISAHWPFFPRQPASPAARLAPFPFSCFSLGLAQHRSDQPSPLPWPISAGNCRRVLFSASPADGQGPRVSAFPILPLAPRQSNRKPATAAPRPCPRCGSVSLRLASTKASRALPRSPCCLPRSLSHSLEPRKPQPSHGEVPRSAVCPSAWSAVLEPPPPPFFPAVRPPCSPLSPHAINFLFHGL